MLIAYKILGLSPGASWGEIRGAYRQLCLRYHPDLNVEAARAGAEERMKEINSAYSILSERVGAPSPDAARRQAAGGRVGPSSPLAASPARQTLDPLKAEFSGILGRLGSAPGFFSLDLKEQAAADRLVAERAAMDLRQLYSRCSEDTDKADCVHYISLCQIYLKKYDKALNNMHYLAEKYPESGRAPFALFYIGLIHLRTGSHVEAVRSFGLFLNQKGIPASFLGIARDFRKKALGELEQRSGGAEVEFGA